MIIDILSAIFVFLFAVFSMRKGAAGAVLKLSSAVLSVLIALFIYPTVSKIVYLTPLPDKISDGVESRLTEQNDAAGMESIDAMPDFIKKNIAPAADEAVSSVTRALADSVAEIIINIVVFAVLFAAVKIIIMLLTGALNLSMKLPVLKQCNSLLGMICGILASLVLLWPVSALLSALSVSHEALASQVNSSYVVAIMSLAAPF